MHNVQRDSSSKPTLDTANYGATESSPAGAAAGAGAGEDGEDYYKKLVDNYDPDEPMSPIAPQSSRSRLWSIVGAVVVVAALAGVVAGTWAGLSPSSSSSGPHSLNTTLCDVNASDAVQHAIRRWLAAGDSQKQFAMEIDICVFRIEADVVQLLKDANNFDDDHQQQQQQQADGFRSVAPDRDAFAVSVTSSSSSASKTRVVINATSGAAAGSGFYWLAKNYFGCQMTWGVNGTGDQMRSFPLFHHTDFSKSRPALRRTVVRVGPNVRYAWNMCTFGYTSTWWDWARWERELDWMLFHGINFPLALLGQEYVWMRVYQDDLNVSLGEIEDWLVGPAFLPWQRAGNIRMFAGPLPREWIVAQFELQKKILRRMRSFGMKPILPCFSGYVPGDVIKRLWPNVTLQQSTQTWGGMPHYMTSSYLLDPVDPKFKVLGEMFMRKLRQVYGFDKKGYYSCDTFNENNPTQTDHTYLRDAGAAVVDSIDAVDKDGVWVMQGWLFSSNFPYWQVPGRIEAYLSGTPVGRLLLLDLHSEDGVIAFNWHSYYGHAFVWCMLHNYGGRHGMYGNLSGAASGPFVALAHPNSTMVGIGFTPEAIEQNPIIYELLTEDFFLPSDKSLDKDLVASPAALQYVPAATAHFNVTAWLDRFLGQRYLAASALTGWDDSAVAPFHISKYAPNVWQAWQLMLHDLYNQWNDPVTEIERAPNINVYVPLGYSRDGQPGVVHRAATLMAAAAESPSELYNHGLESGPFMYDLVDMTRQASVMFFGDLHAVMLDVAWRGDVFNESSFNESAQNMLAIIFGVDDLYASNPNFLFGHWLKSALDAVPSDISPPAARQEVSNLFWYNAKNQVTLWGPVASTLNDYAMKPWQGLYGKYYSRRWSHAIQAIRNAGGGTKVNLPMETAAMGTLEVNWCNATNDHEDYPSAAVPFADVQQLSSVVNKLLKNLSTVSDEDFSQRFELVPAKDAKQGVLTNFYSEMWTGDFKQLGKLCMYLGPELCVGFARKAPEYKYGLLFSSFTTTAAPVEQQVYRRK